jgi:PAS domain S-box-containing protein
MDVVAKKEVSVLASVYSVDEPILVADDDDRLVFLNAAAEDLLGIPAEKAVGAFVSQLFGAPDPEASYLEAKRALRRDGRWGGERTFVNADGARKILEWNLNILDAPALRLRGTISHVHDVTATRRAETELASHRKDLEEQVERRTQQLTEANEALHQEIARRKQTETDLLGAMARAAQADNAKNDFLANMSHEIRTPLNSVINMLRFLLGADLSVQQREFAELAFRSSEALLAVINDVLDYSRIAAGRLELEPAPFDLQATAEEVAQMLAGRAEEQGFEITLHYAPDAPRWVAGDSLRVRQILTNLLSNAVKFTREGGVTVEIRYTPADAVAGFHIRVTDTGIGIEPELMARLFEKFAQGGGAGVRALGGAGLGLAITKRLVDLMHGRIAVQSRVGAGSVFDVVLPLPPAPAPNGAAPPVADLAGKRVLVVANNPANQRILVDELTSQKIRAYAVAAADEALDELFSAARAADPYAIAIVDFELPNRGGMTLARAIKANPELKGVLLLLAASLAQLAGIKRIQDLGFDAYVSKPLRQSLLAEVLSTTWDARRGREAARPPAKPPVAAAAPRRFGIRVLVVEDDAINQIVARKLLEILGCKVEMAADGREAVERLRRDAFDIVFMDASMPTMDGYEATAEIRKTEADGRRVPIVAMTAHALQGAREKCLEAGMDDYIAKPLDPIMVRKTLERWCKSI